ncbi:MAG: TatD family hydrolase [Muribaculaceae bacterium]|nr:TatD family hydrolase [Muribaculaceae bacterium]MDE6803152.1 TatD family hydrolase [Muribaculaceae bacterium]MDE7190674.1 TatD family hydrolase [Muribaculaceae bacterium]
MSLLDIHTHHPAPQPQAVISVSPRDFIPVEGQLYSVGLHPWDGEPSPDDLTLLDETAAHPQVVAIGECGVDPLKGAPMFRQLLTFRHHVELSEQLCKPLIIHEVKAHDIIIGLRRDFAPAMPWAIHGFRGKPTVADMLLKAGLWLSFGMRFNPEALAIVPPDRLLAETDEAPVEISEVIAALSQVSGSDLTDTIAASTAAFLNIS